MEKVRAGSLGSYGLDPNRRPHRTRFASIAEPDETIRSIGAEMSSRLLLYVIAPMKGSPADQAGFGGILSNTSTAEPLATFPV